MSPTHDPRTEGLGLALRPPVRATSIAPPPRTPIPEPSTDPAEPETAPKPTPVIEPPKDPKPATTSVVIDRPVNTPEEPRVGSRRGGSIQVATSIPYAVADALAARAADQDVTIGSVVVEAIRAHAPDVTADVPPRPRRSGKTTVRQFLVSPTDAEQLALYLDRVPASERMTVSLLLRHCLTRHLAPQD